MQPVPEMKNKAFKQGANKLDQNKIITMANNGLSSKEISLTLKINEVCVKSWMPKKKAKKKEA